MRLHSDVRVWIAFISLSLIWGSSYLFIRIGVRQLSPESLVFLRLFVGAVVIGLIALLRRADLRVSKRTLVLLAALGTINTAIPFMLISTGEVHVPSGLASVLNGTLPIFAMLLAGLVLKAEPLSVRKLSGALVGFVGVVVLLSNTSLATNQSALLVGEILILLSSVAYAIGAVFARRFLCEVPSLVVAFWAVFFAAVETRVLSIAFAPPPLTGLHPESILAVLWLGALGSGIAYILAYFILTAWGASRLTLVAYVMPVVGLILGFTVLNEQLDWRVAAGSVLILGGIVIVSASRSVLGLWGRAPAPTSAGQPDAC